MRLESPFYLLLFLVLGLFYFLYHKFSQKSHASLKCSLVSTLPKKSDWKTRIFQKSFFLRLLALALLIMGLSRPQSGESYEEYLTEGIDIILTLDASGSMLAEDFSPKNRLEVAKEKMTEFIRVRKADRIGLVVFGEDSFTLCPMTSDNTFLLNRVQELKVGMVPEDKTAMGLGLANALNRLRESHAKSRVIVLLTDGMNNAGKIDPLTAAQLAKALNVKVYTIGIGKEGFVRIPVQDPFGRKTYAKMKTEIDEDTLKKISQETGGLYFRATSEDALEKIYKTINDMEKTEIKTKIYTDYHELFLIFVWLGLLIFLIERIAARTWLRVLP
ncbi:MAG: VWA domain-containing protein [Chlamydiae bacterium]|nr:VWA domain-containing protein [Chlamydiota bacterium]MBI3267173.1 VWA domain-containing protein [Chlamydiota bacterium]